MTVAASSPAAGRAAAPIRAAAAVVASALLLGWWSSVTPGGFAAGWVALVPWLALLDRTTSLRTSLAAGWGLAVAFVVVVFGWFAVAIHRYTGAPLWLAYAALVVAAPLLEPQLLVFAAARHALRPAGAGGPAAALRVLAAALAYVGAEWALPKLLGDTLGYGFYASAWMRQAADVGGAPGLTLVLLLVNECLLRALRAVPGGRAAPARVAVPIATAGALVCAVAAYGVLRLAQLGERSVERSVTVAAIQAGYGDYGGLAAELGTHGAVRAVLDAHVELSNEARARAPLSLLVWPETVYPTTFGQPKSPDGAAFDREIAGFAAATAVPLVFGAYDRSGDEEFNAALLLERQGDGSVAFDAYRKARPFPLTERVPALLDRPSVRRWLPWLGTWQPGSGAKVLRVASTPGGPLRVAPLVCYDAVDPGLATAAVRDGAQLLVTISNDAWFASGNGALQHFVVAAFRSIETRTPQVRATTTGVSAIVDASGATLARAGVGERAALVARVAPGPAASTLVVRAGDWLGPVAAGAAFTLLLLLVLPARSRLPRSRRR